MTSDTSSTGDTRGGRGAGLRFDAMLPAQPLREAGDIARQAVAAGLSGLVVTEAGRTAYLTCGALATATDGGALDILTGIAVAFPRSPMVTASVAWELAEASYGHFRLGLGAQVRAHIERRYGSAFDPPGPRLKEYVLAVKDIFHSFRTGEPLAVEGEFYALSLLPPMWAPGPIPFDDPPVDIAAVNPWMLRMAGETADGVHVHPLNNPTYLTETVLTEVDAGAARVGRSVEDLDIIVPAFLCVGDTAGEQERWREAARTQIAFYGSTPNYAFIFEQLDREGTTERLRERQRAGDIPGMAAVIDDDLLEQFTTTGTWDDIADKIVFKYGGIATRLVSYFTGSDVVQNPEKFERWGTLAKAVRTKSAGT
ncbi:MAG TPA: TIGR03617 family F420-dependent LLM class oxidoreductase [Luteitalea sp.]|nr:TIGR03617 family F420-dependent LLM class oxidoreductase [Luteitalea sp.]